MINNVFNKFKKIELLILIKLHNEY
jgi:hypothetical protein